LVWSKISNAAIGQVRLLDAKGRIISSPPHEDIEIRLLAQQQVEYNKDGTSVFIAQGSWDSSQHDCLFLNRLTASNTRVLLNLRWEVEVEKCSKPIQYSMDIAVRVQGRDASHFGFKKLLGSQKYLNKYSGVFLVQLRPPMTRRASQLWRLNTAAHHLEGEEYLGSWKPRGVSLINDFKHIQEHIYKKQLVTASAQAIILHTARSQTSQGSMMYEHNSGEMTPRQEELVRKVLGLWKCRFGTEKEVKKIMHSVF
jgi:kinesin family protein 1